MGDVEWKDEAWKVARSFICFAFLIPILVVTKYVFMLINLTDIYYSEQTPHMSVDEQPFSLDTDDKIYLIRQTCTVDRVATSDGKNTCFDLCKDRICCVFNQTDENNAITEYEYDDCILRHNHHPDQQNWCKEFSPCAILVSSHASTSVTLKDNSS